MNFFRETGIVGCQYHFWGGQPMRGRKTGAVPAQLKAAQRQFERWRGSHRGRRRIPESLWAVAVKAAGQFGINRTVEALRVDYYRLKKRVAFQAGGPGSQSFGREAMEAFVELTPAMAPSRGRCLVQLEDRAGSKMRIELETLETSDLVALADSFWRE
jgi:hypothetical protein